MIVAVRDLAFKVQKSFRARGALGTVGRCMSELIDFFHFRRSARHLDDKAGRQFDELYGVDTCGIISLGRLQIESPNWRFGVRYQSLSPRSFNNILARLDLRHDEYIFVDMGSGKGRALLLASMYPFKQIIGVEFSPELQRVAVANIAKFRSEHQRCRDIRSVCMDATAFKIPPDPAVYYFYNPFEARVMEAVLENIERSLQRCSRMVWLVFLHTALDKLAARSERFVELYSDASNGRVSIYHNGA